MNTRRMFQCYTILLFFCIDYSYCFIELLWYYIALLIFFFLFILYKHSHFFKNVYTIIIRKTDANKFLLKIKNQCNQIVNILL